MPIERKPDAEGDPHDRQVGAESAGRG